MQSERLIEKLNHKLAFVRKSALKKLKKRERVDHSLVPNVNLHEVNMSIHTNFSFAPYYPILASYMAYKSGIKIACACDFGTISAQEEFERACELLNIATVSGFEATLTCKNRGEGIYSFYGLSNGAKEEFSVMLEQFREVCLKRAQNVCEKINRKVKKYDLHVDFEKDVYKFIKSKKGASLTLKHLYMATGEKIIEKFGKGRALAEFLRTTLCLDIEERSYNLLCDANNPFYIYDLITALRNNFSAVEGGLTPPALSDYLKVAKKHNCVVAYEYDAPNNWLKNQAESEKTIANFIGVLNDLKKEGINAVCITAHNLSDEMVEKLISVAKENEMLTLFSEKTEYPRDHFESSAPINSRAFLETCAYALLGNYLSLQINEEDGMFTKKSLKKFQSFDQRLLVYSQIGKKRLW